MDGDVLQFAQVMTVIAGFSGFAIVMFFGARWAWHKTKPQPSAPRAQIDDARFERLEQSVDAIAVEIGDVGKG